MKNTAPENWCLVLATTTPRSFKHWSDINGWSGPRCSSYIISRRNTITSFTGRFLWITKPCERPTSFVAKLWQLLGQCQTFVGLRDDLIYDCFHVLCAFPRSKLPVRASTLADNSFDMRHFSFA